MSRARHPAANYRRRKMWVKVPPGHSVDEAPREGGVEWHETPIIEPPVCCESTPQKDDPHEEFSTCTCAKCKSRWYP